MKAICTTTINPPTKALNKFLDIAIREDWQIYIAGDLRTPYDQYYDFIERGAGRVHYIGPDEQEKMSKQLSDMIGWNCIQRRNFAVLAAYQDGAEVLALIDDDNVPYDNWGRNLVVGTNLEASVWETEDVVADPITIAYKEHGFDPTDYIWHRGYPVQLLRRKQNVHPVGRKVVSPLVQADLWDGDPDIDAICRIAINPSCKFREDMWPFTSNKPMPFNSQNTFIHRKVVPFYFLFPHIGRMDDIWAAYVVQLRFPQSVVFSRASVRQERNEHDLVKDLEAEMIGYHKTLQFVERLFSSNEGESKVEILRSFIPTQSVDAFQIWQKLTVSE